MSKKAYVAYTVVALMAILSAGIAGMLTSRVIAADAGYEEQIGGGAPVKVLQDNDVLRSTLISFPKGHVRQGGGKRKLDQVLIYIDKAKYSHLPTPGTQFTTESQTVMEAGQITYHDKNSILGTIRVDEPYRVMYVEIKRPSPITSR